MKVLAALSGGVDSAVATARMVEAGHEVVGVFMKNWSPLSSQSLSDCPWQQDQADAEAVARHLGIPFRSVNFEKQYRKLVVEPWLAGYRAGKTPNPDAWCNREVKFGALLELADELGCEKVVTGHYAQSIDGALYKGLDASKDQAYFLALLNAQQRERAIFPLGVSTKAEVRTEAAERGLPVAQKKDSQGICFIGHLNVHDYLVGELGKQPGPVLLGGEVVGTHDGAYLMTPGQRVNRFIDNRLASRVLGDTSIPPLFVLQRNVAENTLEVTANRGDLNADTVNISTVDDFTKAATLQIRYHGEEVEVLTVNVSGSQTRIQLKQPVWAPAAGQLVVGYQGTRVVAAGELC